jgi:hypothetical protein
LNAKNNRKLYIKDKIDVFVLILYDSIEYTSRDDVFVLILYDSIEYTSRDDVFVLILYDSIEYTSRDDVFVLILYTKTSSLEVCSIGISHTHFGFSEDNGLC